MRQLPPYAPLAEWERTLQWALFLFVLLATWHSAWALHQSDPYEFLRRGYDTLGYYQWLPATFIDQDWGRMYWCHQMADGRWISLFTIGVAVLELPFFLLGHFAAGMFGYAQNGFSAPYGVSMMLGAACYAAAGSIVAFRLARRFSETVPALLAALLLYGATNLHYYSVHEPLMSHVHSFFLVGCYAYCGLRVFDGPRGIHVAVLVASGALLVLIRQMNAVVLAFPLLVAMGPGSVRSFLRALVARRSALLAGLLVGIVPWALQMTYWYAATGQIYANGYAMKGERFEWDRMVPGLVLLGVRNGWLVYTPLMLPVLALLVKRAWQNTPPARAILLLVAITCLLYSAWWSWHLGSGYGHRGFVDLYALLAIPLAWLLAGAMRRGPAWRLTVAVLAVAAIRLNLGLAERFEWFWSWGDWNWQRFFEQVSSVVVGA